MISLTAGGSFALNDATLGVALNQANNAGPVVVIADHLHGKKLTVGEPFAILLKNGTTYRPRDFAIDTAGVSVSKLLPNANASRLAERVAGQAIVAPLVSHDGSVKAEWSLQLRDGSHYVRQFLTITAGGSDLPIDRIQLIDLPLPDAHIVGSVQGSPIIAGNWFLGFEHPISQSKVTAGRATAWIERDLPLHAGQSVTYSSVIGVARDGQMRRDFLAYIERERAHPYRTFLHYNSWYDLGFGNDYDAAGALDRINAFGHELTEKRGVKLDSFLFDDGWDGHNSLWKFNPGFPDGFTPIKQAAEKYHAEPGVWMSPWGGYGKAKQERIAFGKSAGYEIIGGGYALSGPKYFTAFRDVALDMIHTYGVNQFKFDGTGNVDSVFPGSQFDSDFSAAIELIADLRKARPDTFINLTTGTWPSPFWLLYADSTWRGGDDDSVAGVGPYRERWITYRDAQTYENIVQNGPLYPINSLMLHGMIFAQQHKELNKDPDNDFRNEARSYFGTGTQLQEMYITPSLLSQQNWDDLAEAANWSRANAEVLKDTHWIGGNPAWLEVYGWASWTSAKGILVLRNPGNAPQTFSITLQDAFELPAGTAQRYTARSPWKSDAGQSPIELNARAPHEFHLAPFEVLTLDITPR
ncbi:MAG TPA: enterotoxin [Terracidiphilus sp.]